MVTKGVAGAEVRLRADRDVLGVLGVCGVDAWDTAAGARAGDAPLGVVVVWADSASFVTLGDFGAFGGAAALTVDARLRFVAGALVLVAGMAAGWVVGAGVMSVVSIVSRVCSETFAPEDTRFRRVAGVVLLPTANGRVGASTAILLLSVARLGGSPVGSGASPAIAGRAGAVGAVSCGSGKRFLVCRRVMAGRISTATWAVS